MKINDVVTEGFWSELGANVGIKTPTQRPRGRNPYLDTPVASDNTATRAKTSQPVRAKKRNSAEEAFILHDEPVILKYRKQDYALNNNGQWINTRTEDPVTKPFQKYFDSVHDKHLGIA